ncbi:MAG: Oxygen-independent coproporphyrinogen-III oxidase-like protein [Actinomycetia bacterium]|nr:Oxygen-independent coproporphyrinogen-III oxidase-like protein [Actinomycetes bacterium]
MTGARHLYVHLPFCSSRCGYCDFVTVVGRAGEHGGYVEAVLRELELERALLAPKLETVYLGGGTPTLTGAASLARLLDTLPVAEEVTIEANPETVTPELAALLASRVDRVSVGAQTFSPRLLQTLDRVAQPDDVRRAFYRLRDAGIDNISLDLIYGIPGQEPADLARDLAEALALEPEHVSAYELEAKPGTRFTHAHGAELERQAESMETYFERVVETMTAAGYRWYETANFCRVEQRDLRARHNLGVWLGRDYLGLGVGAVSTIESRRWRNAPSLARYIAALGQSLEDDAVRPPREYEELSAEVRDTERVMLGLRLDEPLPLSGLAASLDERELERLTRGGLVAHGDGCLTLTKRGRFLGGGVTARLLA